MKWIGGLTWQEKIKRKEQWHDWFAWRPVVVGITADNHEIIVWLETVERKGAAWPARLFCQWEWLYREKN